MTVRFGAACGGCGCGGGGGGSAGVSPFGPNASSDAGGTVQTSCVPSGATAEGSDISRCTVQFATNPSPGAAGM